MSNEYWQLRDRETLYNRMVRLGENGLAKEYQRCSKEVIKQIESVYLELLEATTDGTLLVSDLYKYNRFYELLNELNKHLTTLGLQEIKITKEVLTDMYKSNFQLIGSELGAYLLIDDNAIENVINATWCQDGKNWSQRIWSNKALLQEKLKEGLIDCVARGVSKDELTKELKNKMNVGFNEADRIVRTELNYVQNKSTLDRFEKSNIKQYKFLAEIDGKTSDVCRKHDGKIYNLDEARVGYNLPPLHPNCRSAILAVVE